MVRMSSDIDGRRPLVITTSDALREELERMCAAVGTSTEAVTDPAECRSRWTKAACVLIGDDMLGRLKLDGLTRASGVVVVAHGEASMQTWQQAVAIRADAVLALPSDRDRLAALLADAAEGTASTGRAVGVIGALGGTGASTFAASVGLVASRRGFEAVLVDADPAGAGIDLLLGCESEAGLRWPDVAAVKGRVNAKALRSALPSCRGLAVLSWAPGPTEQLPAAMLGAMVEAACRGSDLVVVDLGRHLEPAVRPLLARLDTVLIVSGCDVRSVAAASRLAGRLRASCADLRLVLRAAGRDGSDPARVAETLGLPVAAELAWTRRNQRSLAEGLGPVLRSRDVREIGRLLDDGIVTGFVGGAAK